MKYIIHVMGMPSSKYGGIERFNVALSQALLDKGLRSVFVYESYPESNKFVEDLQKSHAELFVTDSRNHPIRFCKDFIQLVKKYHPTIVHAHFTKARFYAIPLAKVMGVERLFFTIHSRMEPLTRIKPLTRMWYKQGNKMAKVIAVSEDIAAMYRSNWPDAQVKRIYLGVDQMHCEKADCRHVLGIPSNQIMILTVANFNHIKGLDVLVRAAALLKDQNRWDENACLYIVGQPEQDKLELGKLVDFLGVGDVVKMIGISNEVPKYLASSDLYVQSSRSEGLPLALMEAASFSLPMIGSNVGGIPEIVKDGCDGFLVDTEDEKQLAEALAKLICNSDLRKKYGENSLKIYHGNFSLASGVDQTLLYYGL